MRDWSTLEPCLFCGDPAPSVVRLHLRGMLAVRCTRCHATGPWANNEDAAMDAWDRTTETTNETEKARI